MDGRRKPPSKRQPRSSDVPDDERLMAALTSLWLKTKHTPDQEASREGIFSTWYQDLSRWPVRQTLVVLNQLASTEEWWPAWSMVEQQLPTPQDRIGYDNPWDRIKGRSVRSWAEDVARAYLSEHRGADRWKLTQQATHVALNDGSGGVGTVGMPFWSGEDCLRKVREYRKGRAA